MKFKIHNLKNFNSAQQEKIIASLNKGCPLIDLSIWENRILKLRMTETKRMTNRQIIDLFRSGKDGSGAEEDQELDIDMEGVFLNTSTIGWTYLGGLKTWMNKKFLNKFNEAEVFGHIIHELLHRYGFSHSGVHSTSVPYSIGYASRYAFLEYYSGKAYQSISAFVDPDPSLTFSIES